MAVFDPTKPEAGHATTQSVRDNFNALKDLSDDIREDVDEIIALGPSLQFGSVAAMRDYTGPSGIMADLATGRAARLLGYYAAGDGGGGTFRWDATSSATPNPGTVFQPTAGGVGRWLRVIETPRNYDFLWFGAKGDSVTDDYDAIMATIDAAKAAGAGVEFSCGDYAVRQRVVINGSGIDPDGTPAGEKTAVHCFKGQGRQPFVARFIALASGTWPDGHAVICGRNLALKTVDNFAIQANGVADVGLDLEWRGTVDGVPGSSAPSCGNTFTNFVVENAKSLGINLDQAADCKISTILYRGGAPAVGISMRLPGGGIWADNIFCANGRFRISCQNSGILNSGFFNGIEIIDEALNDNYFGSSHIYPYTPRKTLAANPFTTTNGSATVTVTWPGHGLVNGNFVELAGCVDTNGILAANLNTTAAAPRAITYVDDNSFTIVAGGAATSTGAAGGSTVAATGRGWSVWSSVLAGSGPRSLTMTACYLNTLGVAGQKHFAGRWLNGAHITGGRIGNNAGAPTDSDVYFDTAHWTVASTDGTPPMFFFNNVGFSVDRPVSVANKVLVGFNGMMQGSAVAANSFPLFEHPGQFHLPNADVDEPIKIGPLPTYLWSDAQGHLRVRPLAGDPTIDNDGFRLLERMVGSSDPNGVATPTMQGCLLVDTTNARVHVAYNTTINSWAEIARLQRGTASPIGSITPTSGGVIFFDSTNSKTYISKGTTNADWIDLSVSFGTMAGQNANSVAITGGTITGITDLAIADGGTGQSTAYAAKDALTIKGADMASAATVDLATATGDYVEVTGNTTITALGTMAAGVRKTMRFTGAPTLTHNATSLIIPGASNIVLSAGNVIEVLSLGSGNWAVVGYSSAGFNATQLVAGTIPDARLPTSQAGKTFTSSVILSGSGTLYRDTATDAISAAGTTQGAATALTSGVNNVTTVAAGADGVRLPATAVGAKVVVWNNDAADTLNVYPASGSSINAGAADAAVTITAGQARTFYAITATKWLTI